MAEFRTLKQERCEDLASRMIDRANLQKEIEVADVTESEDGFTVKFRFR